MTEPISFPPPYIFCTKKLRDWILANTTIAPELIIETKTPKAPKYEKNKKGQQHD